MVPVINQHNDNHCNVVSDSESENDDEENLFDEDVNKKKESTPKNAINAKVAQAKKSGKLHTTMMPT